MGFFQSMVNWFKQLMGDRAMGNSGFTQVQADWQMMCILAAYDLFNTRLTAVGNSNPEGVWLSAQLLNFERDLSSISPQTDGNFQAIAAKFLGYMQNAPGSFHDQWRNLLIDQSSFGQPGDSFGTWINEKAALISWYNLGGNPPPVSINVYTTLFFANLENLFVGVCSNIESFWKFTEDGEIITMASISAEMLVAYYYEQAGSPAVGSGGWAAYQTNLGYLTRLFDYSQFLYPPYEVDNKGYTQFFQSLQTFAQEGTQPQSSALCARIQTRYFHQYETVATPDGLGDFGNYLDGCSGLCSQYERLRSVLTMNSMSELVNTLSPVTILASEPGTNPSTDTVATILGQVSTDPAGPYWGFYNSVVYKLQLNGFGLPVVLRASVTLAQYRVYLVMPNPATSKPASMEVGTACGLDSIPIPQFSFTFYENALDPNGYWYDGLIQLNEKKKSVVVHKEGAKAYTLSLNRMIGDLYDVQMIPQSGVMWSEYPDALKVNFLWGPENAGVSSLQAFLGIYDKGLNAVLKMKKVA